MITTAKQLKDLIRNLSKKLRGESNMQKCKLLLFDLDGTLLRSDKTISGRTLSVLKQCREKGILIGVSTSRSEQNSLAYLNELMPDILISSGGALVKRGSEYIYKAQFSIEETRNMINTARKVCGKDCEISVDTIDAHYWNYKVNPKKIDEKWGDSVYTDFSDFSECSLKMCVEIMEVCKFSTDSIIAFGDDYVDIGMLKLCGTGVAMGNAINSVKENADIVIGSNDEDGIADFIDKEIL